MPAEEAAGPARALLVFDTGAWSAASSADAAWQSLGAGQAAGLGCLLLGCVLRPLRRRDDEGAATVADMVVVGNKGVCSTRGLIS